MHHKAVGAHQALTAVQPGHLTQMSACITSVLPRSIWTPPASQEISIDPKYHPHCPYRKKKKE